MRPALNMLVFLLLTFIGAVLALVTFPFDRSGDTVIWMARLWSKLILRSSGVRLDVETRAPLEPGRPYVFMANHLSTADIWSLFVAVPCPVRMIAKKQLASIPLFGWAMWAGRFIFIDRQNAVAARRSIDEAVRRIASGQSVLIFPEGTRSRDGTLGPFKKGGFHLAEASGADIVPVAIRGSREVMPRRSPLIRPGRITVVLGAPVPTQGLDDRDREALVERVRGAIAGMLAGDVSRSPAAGSGPAAAP